MLMLNLVFDVLNGKIRWKVLWHHDDPYRNASFIYYLWFPPLYFVPMCGLYQKIASVTEA